MSKILQILETYNDFELAALYNFKLHSYMPSTQRKVIHYISTQRNLTIEDLKKLYSKLQKTSFKDSNIRCPRCKSKKVTVSKEENQNTSMTEGFINFLDKKINYNSIMNCDVCGFIKEIF